jgi:hypothetical protein
MSLKLLLKRGNCKRVVWSKEEKAAREEIDVVFASRLFRYLILCTLMSRKPRNYCPLAD